MKILRNHFFICLGIFICYFVNVECLNCYQCSSTDPVKDPYQCNEFFDDSELEPQSCDNVYNAQYCIKQTGRFEGGLGTKRFCSAANLGNYCNYVSQPGDVREYRSCYFTCSGDGCNSAESLRAFQYFWFFLFPSLLPMLYMVFLS